MTDCKLAVVTGGGRGIGRAIVAELASQGWRIVITYKDNAEAAFEAQQLYPFNERWEYAEVGGVSDICEMSFGRQESIENLAARLDVVDVLINNAGGNYYPMPTDDVSTGQWDSTFGANVRGPWLVTRALISKMIHGSAIVNMSSSSAATGGPTSGHYAAAKAGVEALTRHYAKWLAPHIRVNAVAPGYVESEMTRKGMQSPAVVKLVDSTPLGRMVTAQEIARVVAFLCSDEASGVTGQIWRVDGGLVM